MSLKENIVPYVDGYGLVNPQKVSSGTMKGCENGPLYTSQYLMLSRMIDELDLERLPPLLVCIDSKGYLHRSPEDKEYDAPDDHYGLFSYLLLVKARLYVKLPLLCFHPALLYMRGILHGNPLWRLMSPLMMILLSLNNIGEDKGNTSNKLLNWCMNKGLENHSFLCKIGAKIWTWRMRKIYGSTKEIPTIYFGVDHPFVKYWVE